MLATNPGPGLGEFFTEGPMGTGEYFTEPLGQTMLARAPRMGMLRRTARVSPLLAGLGQVAEAAESPGIPNADKPSVAVVASVVVVGLLLRGAAGYYAGKAMAPDAERETKYAWAGVAASVLLGTLGLGIEGAVALANR